MLDLAGFLGGAWDIARRYLDGASNVIGTMDGLGRFVPDGEGLHYNERGVLTLGAYRGEATRGYRFVFPSPHCAEVRFEDGAPFHVLDLSVGCAEVVHDCVPDRYAGFYWVFDRERWLLRWEVRGPRKLYSIVTDYRRAPDQE